MMEAIVEWQLLRREDDRHVLSRIDPEQHRGPPVPEEFADAAAVLLRVCWRAGAHEEIEAEAAIARWNAENNGTAVTTIEGLENGEQTKPWYPAEDYHQEYWEGEGQQNSYCLAVIPPKIMKLRKSFQKYVKS